MQAVDMTLRQILTAEHSLRRNKRGLDMGITGIWRQAMIAWTDEAIKAALVKWWEFHCNDKTSNVEDTRAALDAAVKAQGVGYRADVEASFEAGRHHGRAEALEEAAKVADEYGDLPGRAAAARIRALKTV